MEGRTTKRRRVAGGPRKLNEGGSSVASIALGRFVQCRNVVQRSVCIHGGFNGAPVRTAFHVAFARFSLEIRLENVQKRRGKTLRNPRFSARARWCCRCVYVRLPFPYKTSLNTSEKRSGERASECSRSCSGKEDENEENEVENERGKRDENEGNECRACMWV